MANERLIQALLSGEPYFGLDLRALQGPPERHRYLPAFLKKALEHRPSGNVRILEVGSWAGASAVTWAKSLQALGRQGQVVCVDTWAPYLDLAANAANVYTEMDQTARSGIIKQLFDHNIRASGVADVVEVKVGRSEQILPRLRKKSFDLVYIDGNHMHSTVRSDIANAKQLVRTNGVICGDDLEATADEIAPDLLERYSETAADFVDCPVIGRCFHPGVTRAVGEELGQVSCWEGAWAVVWRGGKARRFEIDVSHIAMPTHLTDEPVAQCPRREFPELVEVDVAGHNIVRYRSLFFALPLALGPVDLPQLPGPELARLMSDPDLSRLRAQVTSGVSGGHGHAESDKLAFGAEDGAHSDTEIREQPLTGKGAETRRESAGRMPQITARADHKPLVFMHISKTAGSNFRYVCEDLLGHENVLFMNTPAEWLNHKNSIKSKLVIAGHVPLPFIEEVMEENDYHLITFLRNPVERAISDYYHCKSAQHAPVSEFYNFCKLFSLKDLCQMTDNAVIMTLNNHFTRNLLTQRAIDDLTDSPDELFSKVLNACNKFDYIAISEKFELELRNIFAKFFPDLDVSAHQDNILNNRFTNGIPFHDAFEFCQGELLDVETCMRLRSLNEVDIRLYNHIVTKRYPELKCFGLPATAAALEIEPDPDFAKWVAKQVEWRLSAAERGIIARDQVIRALHAGGATVEPELVEQDVAEHNIVRLGQRFFAVPLSRGPVDLQLLSAAELAELPSETDLPRLRARLLSSPEPTPVLQNPEVQPAMNDDVLPGVELGDMELLQQDIANGNGLDTTMRVLTDRMMVLGGDLDARIQRLGSIEQDLSGSIGSLQAALTRAVEEAQQASAAATGSEIEINASLALRDERIAALERALAEAVAERQEVRDALEAGLAQRDGRIAALDEGLARVGMVLTERSQAEAARDQRIAVLDERLARVGDALTERSQSEAARDERIAALDAELARRDGRLEGLEASLSQARGATDELRQAISTRALRGTAVERDLAIHAERLAKIELDASRVLRDDRIAALERALAGAAAERQEVRDALEAGLAQRDGQIAALDEGLARVGVELAERSQAEAARDQRIAALGEELARTGTATDELRQAISTRAFRGAAVERDLAIHAERLANVEQEAARWLSQLTRFPPSLDLLPLLARKDFVRVVSSGVAVTASAQPGHFLYGPYLTIEPGFFSLETLCRAGNVSDRDKPVLTIEIVAGTLVIGSRDLLAGALERPVWIAFEISEAIRNRDAKIEFRFSHHGNADIEIAAARLHIANGAHRGNDGDLGRRPRRSFLGIPLSFSRRTTRNGGEIVGGPAL